MGSFLIVTASFLPKDNLYPDFYGAHFFVFILLPLKDASLNLAILLPHLFCLTLCLYESTTLLYVTITFVLTYTIPLYTNSQFAYLFYSWWMGCFQFGDSYARKLPLTFTLAYKSSCEPISLYTWEWTCWVIDYVFVRTASFAERLFYLYSTSNVGEHQLLYTLTTFSIVSLVNFFLF